MDIKLHFCTFILNYSPIKLPREVEVNQTALSARHRRSSPIGVDEEETSCLSEFQSARVGRTGVTSIRRKGATIQLLFFKPDKLFLSPPGCNNSFISQFTSRKIYLIYCTFLDFFLSTKLDTKLQIYGRCGQNFCLKILYNVVCTAIY